MLVLEITNAITIAFLFTEWSLRGYNQEFKLSSRALACCVLLVLFNVVLSFCVVPFFTEKSTTPLVKSGRRGGGEEAGGGGEINVDVSSSSAPFPSPFEDVQDGPRVDSLFVFVVSMGVRIRDGLRRVEDVIIVSSSCLGSSLLIAIAVGVPVWVFLLGVRLRMANIAEVDWPNAVTLLGSICALLALFFRFVVGINDDILHHTEALKEVCAMFAFALLTYVDIKRMNPYFTASSLVEEISRAFPLMMSMYPLLILVVGLLFLAIASLMETLNLETAVLNLPVYYGIIYGPFFHLYYHVKKEGKKAHILPTTQ